MARNNRVIYAAVTANVLVAAAKFTVGIAAGSSALLAEGFHSLADTGDGALLLFGQRRAARPPDETHPFGHGKELYFWTLVVAVCLFTVGGLASIVEGIAHIRRPHPLTNPWPTYVVLIIAGLLEGGSMLYAWRQFLREKSANRSISEAVIDAKDPTTFMVVFEDTAAVVGVIIALAAVYLAHRFDRPKFDGAGAIFVGVLMSTVATFLIFEIRKLLVGERVLPEQLQQMQHLIQSDPCVISVEIPRTMHFGPDTVMAAVRVQFRPNSNGSCTDIPAAIDRLHEAVRAKLPMVKYLYIEPQRVGEAPEAAPVKSP